MNLNLRHLARFLAILDHGTFSAAALHLHLTQQALSTSIAKLEEQLGVPLFERSPGGRTSASLYGRALARHARALMDGEQRALQELRDLRNAAAGDVTIGVGEVLAGQVIAKAVAQLHAERPDVRIHLLEGFSEEMNQRLLHGEIDFVAGAMRYDPGTSEWLVHEHLFDARDVVAVRRNHPLTRLAAPTLEDLAPFTWIIPAYHSDEYDAICEAFVAARLPAPTRFIRSDTLSVGMSLLLREDYLALAPPTLLGFEPASQLAILNVDRPSLVRSAGLTFRRHTPLSPVASALADAARAAVEDLIARGAATRRR